MDAELSKVFKNAFTLLSGHAVAAILQAAALALTARALGPEQYGTLVLIQAWVVVVDRIFNFQSWQIVIRYGAEALEENDASSFASVVRFAAALDFGGAWVGAIVAAGAIAVGAHLFDWSATTERLGIAYAFVIAFHWDGAPTGVLRLLDRFRWFSVQATISAATRLALVAWAYFAGASLEAFVLVWAIADVFSHGSLFVLGWIALSSGHSIRGGSIRELRGRHPDLVRFAIFTNLESSVRHVIREVDVFLVRAFLDATAVGHYGLIKQLASIPDRATNPLYHSLLPVIARLWAKRDLIAIRRYVERTRTIGFGVAALLVIAFLVAGPTAIALAFGDAYAPIYLPAAIALAGTSLWAASYAYSALLVAMGLVRAKLRLTALASVVSIALQCALLPVLGLIGASIGFAFLSITWIASAWIVVRDRLHAQEG